MAAACDSMMREGHADIITNLWWHSGFSHIPVWSYPFVVIGAMEVVVDGLLDFRMAVF